MTKRGLFAILFVMTVMSFTIFNSCDIDIGLGAAVDTEVPTLKIENPPASKVIRDEFPISGTWTDDGVIHSIIVSLENTETHVVYPEISSSIGDKTWAAKVDPVKSKIPDGKYEATITITDKSGHSSKSSRAFTIDNTPPIVVLQRPSTTADDTDSDLFGQKFTLTGQAADNNDIETIRVRFYSDKECKNELDYVDLDKVPPTIDLDVATFEANIENHYSKIYGETTKNGKKSFYFSIEAYDGARRYTGAKDEDLSEEDKSGNVAKVYYPYESVYKLISTYKATGLYNIVNGTYTASDSSRELSDVEKLQVLEALKENETAAGRFSLNPANNPEFKVVGREGLTKDDEGKIDFSNPSYSFTNESNISLKVAMGLDSIPVVKDTLKVYLLKCTEEGKTDDSFETVTSGGEQKRIYKNRIYPAADAVKSEPSDGGYTLTAKIIADQTVDYKGDSKNLEIGETYIIAIEGYDQENNEVVAEENKLYGFKIAPNGAAPIVEIKTCVNPTSASTESDYKEDAMLYVPRYNPENTSEESEICFKGTVQVGDGTPTLEVKIDGEAPANSKITLTPDEDRKGLFTFVYTVPVNKLKDYEKSGQHNVIFTASLSDTAEVKKSIMYQVDKPKVTLSRVEPFAYKYLDEAGNREKDADGKLKQFLNGKNVKLNVTIIAGAVGLNEEDESKKAKIEFIQGDIVKLAIDSPTFGETQEIDTTQFDEDELLIRITAYDMAGNKTVTEEKFYVDQNTDNPVILPKNSSNSTLDLSESVVSNPNYKTNNVYSANQTVIYKLIDDDGLSKAYYEIKKTGASEPVVKRDDTEISLNDAADYQLEVNMPPEPATYKVVLYTEDKIAGTSPNKKEFYVRVTAGAPTIERIKLDPTNYKNLDTVSPEIKIKSDQVPFILTRKITNASGTVMSKYTQVFKYENPDSEAGIITKPILNTSSPLITDGIVINKQDIEVDESGNKSGAYTISYTVEDKNGKIGESSIDFTLDFEAPEISYVEIEDIPYDDSTWNKSKTLKLSVKASDSGTGIETVEYSTNGSTWTRLSKTYTGSAVFDTEGPLNALYICATDVAGNKTYFDGVTSGGTQEKKSINVKIDTYAPILSVDKYKVGSLEEKEIDKSKIYVNSNTGLKISGTFADDESGINSTITIFKEVIETITDPENNTTTKKITKTQVKTCTADSEGNWSVNLSKNDNFIGKLIFEGKNNAGATSSVSPFEVILDDNLPSISNISLASSNKLCYKKNSSEYYINNKNGNPSVKITGIATDDKGVDEVTLWINNVKKNTSKDSDFTFTIPNSDFGTLKTIPVKIVANDIAGNEFKTEFEIKVDTTAPAGKHIKDTSDKDIYFRIGDQVNDAISKTTNPIFTTEDDSDVGGKYYSGTYGNTTTVKIRGLFEDAGSGVQRIYYKVFNGTTIPSSEAINNFLQDYETEASEDPEHVGYISPKTDTKRVFYSDKTNNGTLGLTGDDEFEFAGPITSIADNTEKYYTSITTNFKELISGFEAGTNYIVLVAVDNVGNAAVDEDLNGNKYFQINVDVLPPMITSAGNVYTKPAVALPLAFTVTDLPATLNAGVKKVIVKFNEKEYEAELKKTGNYAGKYYVEIPEDDMPSDSDSYPISVTAIDYAGAGNSGENSGGNVIVDKDPPDVKINVIPDADKTTEDLVDVNGVIEISGSASDTVQLSSVLLEYKKDDSSINEWTEIEEFTGNDAYNWNVSFDTTDIKDKDGKYITGDYIIKATAHDSAGNSSDITRKIYVNQDSNRPVIKLMSLSLPETAPTAAIPYQNSELTGILSDDDDVPLELAYRFGSTGSFTDSKDSNGVLTYSSTDGQFTLQMEDTESQDVYFRITTQEKDSENNYVTFETKKTSANLDLSTTPKLTDKTGVKYGYKKNSVQSGTVLTFRVDITAPSVDYIGFSVDSAVNGADWQATVSTQTFGGTTNNTFYLNQFVYDKVEIKSVTVDITPVDNDEADVKHTYNFAEVEGSVKAVSNYEHNFTEWRSEQINVNGLASGTREFTIRVYDGVNTTTSRVNINIDNTKPRIDFTGPSSSTSSSGSITAYGTVDSDSDVYYAISTSGTIKPGNEVKSWTGESESGSYVGSISDIKDLDGAKYKKINDASLSWFVYFDGLSTSGTHAPVLNDYLTAYGITTSEELNKTEGAFDTIVNLYIWIKCVDRVGNITETSHLIKLDPQGDRPTVAVSYPNEDGQTLGGVVRITGSANDEKGTSNEKIGVDSVWVQIISSTHNDIKFGDTNYEVSGKEFGTFTKEENIVKGTTFKIKKADLDYLYYAGYPVKKMSDGTAYNPLAENIKPSDYAIQATLAGSSWSVTLNNKSEFNPSSGINGLAMRVYAKDKDKKLSVNTDKYMVFDSSNPIIGSSQPLYLIKSDDNSITLDNDTLNFKDTASREYIEDMFIKGDWWIIGSVEDNDAIKTLKIGSDRLIKDGEIQSNDNWMVLGTGDPVKKNALPTEDDPSLKTGEIQVYKTVYFKYKLTSTNQVDSLSNIINAIDAADGTPGNTNKTIVVNIDNVPPTLAGAENTGYKLNPNIHQDEGYYYMESMVSEPVIGTNSQSELDSVAFFFMRRNITGTTEVDNVYNPMIKGGYPVEITSLHYEDGLYWKEVTVCRSDDLNILESVTADSNIRKNGLVKIGGSIYKISGINGTSVTINGNPKKSADNETAYFAYALTIDNTIQESGSTTTKSTADGYLYPETITNDDGDGFVEYIKKTGTNFYWSASIVSSNIPDGPIELHYVAFDKAGNYSIGIMGNMEETEFVKTTESTYAQTEDRIAYQSLKANNTVNVLYVDAETSTYNGTAKSKTNYHDVTLAAPAFISNNAPRLSGVIVATDTNGDGTIDESDDDEWFTNWSSTYDTWEKSKIALTIPSDSTDTNPKPVFTTKGLTKIKPEIIGGNGEIKYNYIVAKRNTGNTAWDNAYYTKNALQSIGTQIDDSYQSVLTNVTPIEFTVKDFLTKGNTGNEIEDGDNQKFTFTIWDSTDGTICGDKSQYATLNLIMSVKLRDNKSPEAEINPFFWESLNKNSIYGSDLKDEHDKFVVKTVNDLVGHVELEPDADTNPDLSGKVVLRGTASDSKMVKKLYISIPEMATKFAAVTEMTKKPVTTGEVSTDYYLAATYNSQTSSWTTYGDLTTNGFAMKITKSEFDATGHSVEWEFDWDTSAISTTAPAKEGIVVKLLAEDEGIPSLSDGNVSYAPNTSAEGTAQTTEGTKTAKYTVDVVPYITSITRGSTISGGAMNRSKLGSYPVSEGETLTVTGFNLIGGTWTVGSGHTEQTAQPTGAANIMNGTTKTGKDRFTMTVPAYSGNLSVTVASVESVNNSNRDDLAGNKESFTMKGSSVQYTAQDNRYLAVWNLGNFFKNTDGGAELQKPVMTADRNGNLYASWAAQSNSNIMFSYGVKEDTTAIFRCYDQPATYTGIGFDTKGTDDEYKGGASIAFIPEHQGAGGTFSKYALSSSIVVGGAGAIQLDSTVLNDKKSYSGLAVNIPGNPSLDLDSNGNTSSYYNLQNYDMTRRIGSFINPKSAKYNKYMHTIWYDTENKGLKYSVVDTSDNTKYVKNAAGVVGWVVLDGGYTGQDRLHSFTAVANTTRNDNTAINNRLLTYGYLHVGLRTGEMNMKNDRPLGKNSTFQTDVFYNGDNKASSTSTSVTYKAQNQGITPKPGDTIALLQNTDGDYAISLRQITSVENNEIKWTGEVNHNIDSFTVYAGDLNVVEGAIDDLNASSFYNASSGSSADIDVDSNGRPVVVYLDDESSFIRIAKATSEQPHLATEWNRIITNYTCAGEISVKVDSNNNLHIMYKNGDGQLCYLFGTPDGNTYNFNKPEIIDETGSMDYGSLSVIESGTGTTKTCIPCVSYLNSAGTAQAVKYAVRSSAPSYSATSTASETLSEDWDFMILPSLGAGHYAVKENQVSLEARKTGWTGTGDTLRNGGSVATATPATVKAAIAFKSNQFETAYLKTE